MSTEIEVFRAVDILPDAPEASDDDDLIELWLHERSRHTQRAYRADVGHFRFWAGKPLLSTRL